MVSSRFLGFFTHSTNLNLPKKHPAAQMAQIMDLLGQVLHTIEGLTIEESESEEGIVWTVPNLSRITPK